MSLKEVRAELNKSKDDTKIKLSDKEIKELVSNYRNSEKITYQKFMTQVKREDIFFPQPVRSQPTMEIFTSKENEYSVAQRILKLSAKEVKKFGKKVIADVKIDGMRGLLVIDPKKQEVKVYSRNLKPLKKFEKKYSDKILKRMSELVKDKTIMDVELCALGKENEILPTHTVIGWVKNPTDEKYDEIKSNVQAFDIVMLNSKDVRELPLKYRKRLLEIVIDKDTDLETVDTRLMANSSRLIDWLFNAKVNKRGFEGIVIKDPESKYELGKTGSWVKVKQSDSLDLRLVGVDAWPRKKVFQFYRHWVLSPSDSDLILHADKGIKSAMMGNDYYIKFTKNIIRKWKEGKYEGIGKMIPVAAKFKSIYGVDKVPEKIKIKNGPIIELFVEAISDNLKISGAKIVRVRSDKRMADTVKDIICMRDMFRGAK